MTTGNHLLLVEDDRNLGYILSEYLVMKGFEVTWSQDGAEALALIRKHPYALCILDVMLPSMDGFSIAEQLGKAPSRTPYIFLTAKNLKVDKLKGFKIGCDDYITKPVDEEELVARIHAILNRTAATPVAPDGELIRFGNATFHVATQQLETDQGRISLTAKEAALLQLLLRYRNGILDRETALKQVWGSNDYFNRRSMDVIISRLRKRLASEANIRITNIHGKGYKLEI